jgi:hypothetical protein
VTDGAVSPPGAVKPFEITGYVCLDCQAAGVQSLAPDADGDCPQVGPGDHGCWTAVVAQVSRARKHPARIIAEELHREGMDAKRAVFVADQIMGALMDGWIDEATVRAMEAPDAGDLERVANAGRVPNPGGIR